MNYKSLTKLTNTVERLKNKECREMNELLYNKEKFLIVGCAMNQKERRRKSVYSINFNWYSAYETNRINSVSLHSVFVSISLLYTQLL